MLKKLALTTLAAAALATTSFSTANAGGTVYIGGSGWGCRSCGYSNGTQVTGIARESASVGSIGAVILPSGEIVDLR